MAKWIRAAVLLALPTVCVLTASGCSATSAAMAAVRMGQNASSNRLDTRIYLDGTQAKRNEIKQAAMGHSRWKIKGDVSTAPRLRFDFKEPDALGRIRMVTLAIFQKFEADYSGQAEFALVSRDSTPEGQMKPGVEYDLGNPGPAFRVTNWRGDEVPGVRLIPGKEYMLTFTVSADQSETAQVYFTANTDRPGMVGTPH